jgi:hypothetical protein
VGVAAGLRPEKESAGRRWPEDSAAAADEMHVRGLFCVAFGCSKDV